ncbi:MAG: aminotransferase class I/II-fold pyridoxal phosphate-dependent enzyme, partial [Fusobacteriaceae bacterium]
IEKILKKISGNLMLDETYIEFTESEKYSSASLVERYTNIFVIRGTSKFFSTPGIRLGYGILGESSLKDDIFNLSNLWNINIFATLMGEIMFKDNEYIDFVKKNIKKNIHELYNGLEKIKEIKVYPTSSNFILCEILGKKMSYSLKEYLLKNGIIIRDASDFPGLNEKFFRVCALKEEENIRLLESINKFFQL